MSMYVYINKKFYCPDVNCVFSYIDNGDPQPPTLNPTPPPCVTI